MKYQSFLVTLASLASALAAPVEEKDLTLGTTLYSTWSYIGCRSDNVSARALDGAMIVDSKAMTGENCINYCSVRGYTYAGTGG